MASEMRNNVTIRQNIVARRQKSIKDPKTLTFYFGVNVINRACDGMFVYNCSRLIKMYQRIGPQQDSSMMCRGVVGIVDVPYMVLGRILFIINNMNKSLIIRSMLGFFLSYMNFTFFVQSSLF